MTDTFDRLRRSIERIEQALDRGDEPHPDVAWRILFERTARVAQEPVQVDAAPDVMSCLVFERSGRRYAAPLERLQDTAPLGSIAAVPGAPPAYLGVTARRGKIVAVLDLPRLFSSASAGVPERSRWMIMVASEEISCAVAADELHDVMDIGREQLATAMPGFPSLVQRHTLGVLEDRTVVLDLAGLLADPALRVEERDL